VRGDNRPDVWTPAPDIVAEGAADHVGHRYVLFFGDVPQLLGQLVVDTGVDVLHKLGTRTPASGVIGY
jgi:hypothetical protein